MRSFSWRWSLVLSLLLLLASSMAGCVAIYGKPVAEPSPSPVPAALASVGKPVINSFAASPEAISSGQAVTLSWDVSGATVINISPAIGGLGASGSKQVTPNSTTTYILTATNETGSSTALATVVATPAEETVVGYDPVTGRNQEINFTWEELCFSSEYQVQIAKDPAFAMIIFDSGVYTPSSSTSPALVFPAGAASSAFGAAPPFLVSQLEPGHTYYYRVRARRAATGQAMLSPWGVGSFTTAVGLPASASYYGLALLSPPNGCVSCPVKPVSFSWSPFKDTTKYRFVLAKDAAMSQVVVTATTMTTGYAYEGTLDYSASYFWRVMTVEPAPSDWSATFSLQTMAAPGPAPALPPAQPATPLWAWVVIGGGSILVIATVVLIFAIRRG